MPQTIRKFWGPHQGRVHFNYNWRIINQDSVVLITAAEYLVSAPPSNEHRFIGDASITVENIAPHGPPYDSNHGVTFIVNVDWGSPLYVVTDITVLDDPPVEVDFYTPPTPPSNGLRMQYQESNEWCWIAVATSISHFYNPASTWTQCAVMTDIGHRINHYPPDTSACPTAEVIADNPVLKAALADPYANAAEYILDNPAWGVDRRYLKSGGVGDALTTTGNYASSYGADLSLNQIADEVNAGRPVAVDITWNGGPSHVVAIAGVSGDILLTLDPINGQSVIPFKNFPATYFDGARLDGYTFTKNS
jgi:hypothetical protein